MPSEVCREENPLTISRLPSSQLVRAMTQEYGDLATYKQRADGRHLRGLLKSWEDSGGCRGRLTIESFAEVARPGRDGRYRRVEIDPSAMEEVETARREVDGYLAEQKLVYGVTTGYGSNRKHLFEDRDNARRLSANILYSHATGVGRPLPTEVVRGMLLLRLWTFAQGYSGVSPVVLEKLVDMLNRGVVPYIPEKGSVGCSGDLCSLAHLFLVLIGQGRGWVIKHPAENYWRDGDGHRSQKAGALLGGRDAMQLAGIDPLEPDQLQAKDGLALTNGATLSTAVLALAVLDAELLYKSANISGSLTHQAVSGHTRVFEPHVGAVRPHAGQVLTAWEMYHLLQDSTLKNRCALIGESQDDYSVRSIAAVHGAVWDSITHARRVAEIEINAATDNPLFFKGLPGFQFKYAQDLPKHELVDRSLRDTYHCSAANFHGEPVALALDFLKIALAELASLAERRIQLLLDGNHNRGLPDSLALGKPGLQTGFMLAQYTAAALVSENKVLCHPSSVDSIPTSANAEDHVSMAANAARHLRQVVENVTDVIAVEILCGLQALDIRTSGMKRWIQELMALDSETIQRVRTRLGLNPGTVLTATEPSQVRCFLEEKFGENAVMLFPNWVGEHPKTADELLDTGALRLSSLTQGVYDLVRRNREQGGLDVPLIVGDGLPHPSHGMTFQDHPPSDLIDTVAAAIRDARIVGAVWGEPGAPRVSQDDSQASD